jgi:hypothetical protein
MISHLTHVLIKNNEVGFVFWKFMDICFFF